MIKQLPDVTSQPTGCDIMSMPVNEVLMTLADELYAGGVQMVQQEKLHMKVVECWHIHGVCIQFF
jgi:hypothetical protein